MLRLDSMNQRDITEMLQGMVISAYYTAHTARLGVPGKTPNRELKLADVAEAFRNILANLE